jgi:hypothetical protein
MDRRTMARRRICWTPHITQAKRKRRKLGSCSVEVNEVLKKARMLRKASGPDEIADYF